MPDQHLNQIELATRWNISHRTLERWRWRGEGPSFVKLGGRVVYRQRNVEAFEESQLRRAKQAIPVPRGTISPRPE